jgi:hypothetical protein
MSDLTLHTDWCDRGDHEGACPQPCEVCLHADRTGSWVDAPGFENMTHCRACHGSWKRQSEFQHCTGCHRTFTNWRAADMHREGGQCLDPVEVRTKAGKPKLARSTRRLDPRTTVELWARAGEAPQGAWGSGIQAAS